MAAMDWSNRKVLVTGAGGFIGSHLTERLVEAGAETRALILYNSNNSTEWLAESPHRDEIRYFFGDVRDRDSLQEAMRGVDVVFHLAALISIPYSYRAPLSYARTNVEGTINVLQQALSSDVGLVVHTSTSETYGTAMTVPIPESHPLQGQSPYAASKIGADKMAEAFHLTFGLPVATIRPFNTYGPRQSARAVIPTIITQALTREEIRLGNLEPTRDLTFVADTVDGFLAVAQCSEAVGTVTNVGTGQEIRIGELAEKILTVLGEDKPIRSEGQRIRPEKGEVQRLCADNRRARELLGWEPAHSLDEGIGKTADWMRDNLQGYRPDAYSI